MTQAGLVIYTGPRCPGCVAAKQWMTQSGIAYQDVDVTRDPSLVAQLVAATGQRTVPQFFLNGEHLSGGFLQVQRLHAQGRI